MKTFATIQDAVDHLLASSSQIEDEVFVTAPRSEEIVQTCKEAAPQPE